MATTTIYNTTITSATKTITMTLCGHECFNQICTQKENSASTTLKNSQNRFEYCPSASKRHTVSETRPKRCIRNLEFFPWNELWVEAHAPAEFPCVDFSASCYCPIVVATASRSCHRGESPWSVGREFLAAPHIHDCLRWIAILFQNMFDCLLDKFSFPAFRCQ